MQFFEFFQPFLTLTQSQFSKFNVLVNSYTFIENVFLNISIMEKYKLTDSNDQQSYVVPNPQNSYR
jgi:hypothetical protein